MAANEHDERRHRAERKTEEDLSKQVAQLVCDVHDGAFDPATTEEHKLLYATRRMVSLMGRVAIEQERSAKYLLWLTWVLVAMTAVLIVLTVFIVVHELGSNPSMERTSSGKLRLPTAAAHVER